MNRQTLWPALVAVPLTAAALIANCVGTGFENQEESGRHHQAREVVERDLDRSCVALNANGEHARLWSVEYQQMSAMGIVRPGCVKYH